MSRATYLCSAPNEPLALLQAERFRACRIPVVLRQTSVPYPNPLSPVEIWLADASLLEREEKRSVIEAILGIVVDGSAAATPAPKPVHRRGEHPALVVAFLFVLLTSWAYICWNERYMIFRSVFYEPPPFDCFGGPCS